MVFSTLLQIRPRCCGTHCATVQQSKCLALLSITWWALGSKSSTRLRGLWRKVPKALREVSNCQVLQKLWGSPEERFQQSFTLSWTRIRQGRLARFTGPRLHRRGLMVSDRARIAPSGPDRGSAQLGPVNCTKLASLVFLGTAVRPHVKESRR